MDYYTLLTIFYTVAEHGTFKIWFPSEADCWRVLLESGLFLHKGTSGHCDVSEVMSRIVKPKLRPW